MPECLKKIVFLWMTWLALLPAFVQAAPPPITEEEAYIIGVEAYTYAYPMLLMEFTRRVGANVTEPDSERHRSPTGRIVHSTEYKNASNRDIVRPNADTLYSRIWFDLARKPLVLTLPDTGSRYHVIPLYDMWTDVYASLGIRTNGNGGGLHWKASA